MTIARLIPLANRPRPLHDARVNTARALLVSVCEEVGFPPPRPAVGLAEWADNTLDVALGPRGSETWSVGHEHACAALEAALEGSREIARVELAQAVALVGREGRRTCKCSPRGVAARVDGRSFCVKCGGRQ